MKLPGTINALVILLSASPLCAQVVPRDFDPQKDPRRDYVHFPIGKNVDALVKERLQMEQQLGPFKDLARQVLADPDKFGIDPKMFKDVKMDDPKLKKAVQAWAAHDKELQKTMRDWAKRMPDDKRPDVNKLQKELKQILDQPPKTAVTFGTM